VKRISVRSFNLLPRPPDDNSHLRRRHDSLICDSAGHKHARNTSSFVFSRFLGKSTNTKQELYFTRGSPYEHDKILHLKAFALHTQIHSLIHNRAFNLVDTFTVIHISLQKTLNLISKLVDSDLLRIAIHTTE